MSWCTEQCYRPLFVFMSNDVFYGRKETQNQIWRRVVLRNVNFGNRDGHGRITLSEISRMQYVRWRIKLVEDNGHWRNRVLPATKLRRNLEFRYHRFIWETWEGRSVCTFFKKLVLINIAILMSVTWIWNNYWFCTSSYKLQLPLIIICRHNVTSFNLKFKII